MGLLHFAKVENFQGLQIARDSMVIVKCFQGVYSISSMVLEPWKKKIRESQEYFFDISIQHIHKRCNNVAYGLSKGTLRLDLGLMLVEEFEDGL